MNYLNQLQDAIKICLFDKKALSQVLKEKNAWKYGLLMILLGNLAQALFSPFQLTDVPFSSTHSLILGLFLSILSIFVINFLAKLFGKKLSYKKAFGVFGYIEIIDFVFLIPPIFGEYRGILDTALLIWSVAIGIFVLRKMYGFSFVKIVFLVIIFLFILVAVMIILLIPPYFLFPEQVGLENPFKSEWYEDEFFEELLKPETKSMNRVLLLEPNIKLPKQDLFDIREILSKKIEIAGYANEVTLTDEDLFQVKSSTKFVENKDFLESIIQAHSFEAKVGDETIFTNGQDIEYVCNSPQCAGPSKTRRCIESGDDWLCYFEFTATVSDIAARRMAEATKDLEIVQNKWGEYLNANMTLHVDGKVVDILNIAPSMKGEEIKHVSISGGGRGDSKERAMFDTVTTMRSLQAILATSSLPANLSIVQIE